MYYCDKLSILEALSKQPQREVGPAVLLAWPPQLAAYDMAGRIIANCLSYSTMTELQG